MSDCDLSSQSFNSGMAWQIRSASLLSAPPILNMDPTTGRNGAHSLQGNPMSKNVPNLDASRPPALSSTPPSSSRP